MSRVLKLGVELKLSIPKPIDKKTITMPYAFKMFSLSNFVEKFTNGGTHSISEIYEGKIPLISCKTEDNGIVGYYDVLEKDKYIHAYTIAGDGSYPVTTYYHFYPFGSYDNVNICPIKKELSLSTIFFLASRLNRTRWRFSYGRKCYNNKVTKLEVFLPVNKVGKLDEEFINSLFEHLYGWAEISEYIRTSSGKIENNI